MPIEIEVSLKIPTLTLKNVGENDRRIDNSDVRFRKRMMVSAVPKRGDQLDVTVDGEPPFPSRVTRADWDEEKMLFVVACAFSRRAIMTREYTGLLSDP